MNPASASNNADDNLGLSLLNDGVAGANLTDASLDTAEALLDGLTAAGDILEAFPVFGTAAKLIRAGFSIHDRAFMRKMARFLTELQHVSAEERYAFVREMDRDPAFKKKVGEKLILLLDRFDDLEKANVLGKLFRAYLVGRADYDLFGRLAGVIDRVYLPDLARLHQNEEVGRDDAVSALVALGLMRQTVIGGGNARGEDTSLFQISSLGQRLAALIFTS